jgi:hypothetical protein
VRQAGRVPYLLRVVLPDRPGMLGAVATAIGTVGGDIVSLDVVERGPDGAVDDLLVQLPAGGLADALITSAQSVPGVQVESLRPYLGADDLHRDLELVDEMAASPAQAPGLLVETLPGVFRASWAALVEQGRGVLRSGPGAPETDGLDLPWLPLPRAVRLPASAAWVPQRWRDLGTELAAAPVGRPEAAVLVGRIGGPRWRDGELARLAHLAGITATVLAS